MKKDFNMCDTTTTSFQDQVIFAKKIWQTETDGLDIRFYVSDDVYSMHESQEMLIILSLL